MPFKYKAQMPEHPQRMLVVLWHIHPHPGRIKGSESPVHALRERHCPIMMVPKVFAANDEEKMGLQQRLLYDQLAFSNVLAFAGVDREYLSVFIFEDPLPFLTGGFDGLVWRIPDVKGLAVLVQAIPERIDFDIIQPLDHPMDILGSWL